VFLQNYHALAIFYNYRIIFLLKISWNRSTVRWTESTVAGAWVHGLSLNESCRLPGQRLRFKKCEGVSHNLIVVVNLLITGVSRYRRSGPPNSTKFSPTALWRREEFGSLTLGRQQTAVAAGDDWRRRGGSVGFERQIRQAPVLL
jgi:hypothetical protein